jgi:GGDEF domain-containing protein
VVLLPGCRDPAAARTFADGLRARLHPPYSLPDGPIQLDASVGIACFPTNGTDPDALLAHADRAMYAAKREGRQLSNAALGSTPDGTQMPA